MFKKHYNPILCSQHGYRSFENQNLYEKYRKFALEEKSVHFLGRLANYRYFNMDAAILNALEYFDKHFSQ